MRDDDTTTDSLSVPAVTERDPLVRNLERKIARLRRATAAFRQVAAAITTPVDLDRVLKAVLDNSPAVVNAERATLYLYDSTEQMLYSRFSAGGRIGTIEVPLGQGIAGSVAAEGRPLRVADAYDDARFSPRWDRETGFRTRSVLAVPMKNHQGKIIGVLQALNKRGGGTFDRDDELLFSSFATQAAIAIENTRLILDITEKNEQLAAAHLSLERRVRELKFLFDLESAMAWASSEHQLAESLLKLMIEPTHARLAALLLVPTHQGPWQFFAIDRKNRKKMIRATVRPSVEGLLSRALRKGRAIRRGKLSRSAGDLAELEQVGLEASSGVATPLVGEGDQMLGVLALFDRMDGRPFGHEDGGLLRLVAANVSTALVLLRARESQRVNDRMSTIGSLLSGVMHDLKTPMAVIGGYAQLLVDTDDREQRREYADLILEQVSHMTAMQREVLDFARGAKTLLVQKVYLGKFFGELQKQIEREIKDRPVELRVLVRDQGIAWFDQTKITRAIHNLARNAVDAMGDKGGLLTIEVSRDRDSIEISVRDTGPGIPPELEGKIFESFVSVGKERGTGLGLAIVRKIVEQHGGTVRVESSSEGASFFLRLPQDSRHAGDHAS